MINQATRDRNRLADAVHAPALADAEVTLLPAALMHPDDLRWISRTDPGYMATLRLVAAHRGLHHP